MACTPKEWLCRMERTCRSTLVHSRKGLQFMVSCLRSSNTTSEYRKNRKMNDTKRSMQVMKEDTRRSKHKYCRVHSNPSVSLARVNWPWPRYAFRCRYNARETFRVNHMARHSRDYIRSNAFDTRCSATATRGYVIEIRLPYRHARHFCLRSQTHCQRVL